jgi:hypothetical protein
MENCSLALHIPEYGSESMEIARIGSTVDVWSLAVDSKVDLQKLSYKTLPRRVSKIGTFTPRYNTTELLPSFTCESGTYYAFLLTCPEGAHKESCWIDVTSTKEELVGMELSWHPYHRSRDLIVATTRRLYCAASDDLRLSRGVPLLPMPCDVAISFYFETNRV